MVQDNDLLYSRMHWFFDHIPDFHITENEHIVLAWSARGDEQEWSRQYMPDLEQAAVGAIALGPAYDICIWVTEHSGPDAQDGGRSQLLVLWHNREQRPGDNYPRPGTDVADLVYPRGGLYGMSVRYFADANSTCEAIMFSYPSRPYTPVRHRIVRELPSASDDRGGKQR